MQTREGECKGGGKTKEGEGKGEGQCKLCIYTRDCWLYLNFTVVHCFGGASRPRKYNIYSKYCE